MFFAVFQELTSDAADQRVRRVCVGEQGADAQQHLRDRQRRTPVVLEYVETDDALRVDVAVVDAGLEGHLWWFEGVVRGEVYVEEEDPALVAGTRRAQNS